MAHHFVRRDVWQLPENNHTLRWYARAVTAMRARDDRDPTSWVYQANIHGSVQGRSRRFNQCKHGSWNFLAWHRLYLYYFERIVRAAVVEAGGPRTWALPYWNYERGGNAAKLPRAFRLPAADSNALYVARRRASYNAGQALRKEFTTSKAALDARHFTAAFGAASFGGGRRNDRMMMAGEPGLLEIAPHNVIHTRIGGNSGWMNDLDLAARDPIFWLHHANIDRLWAHWIALGHGRANPTGRWLRERFAYFDEHGKLVHATAADALTTEVLHYRYGDEPRVRAAAPMAAAERRPHLVGTSRSAVTLRGARASVRVPVDSAARNRASARLSDGERPRVYLNLDDVRAPSAPGTVYGVYVNLPDDARPDETHLAGVASFFGITRAARPGSRTHGYRLSYDITELRDRLAAAGQWDDANVHVSFHPLDEEEELPADVTAEDVAHEPVTVGRISLFHA